MKYDLIKNTEEALRLNFQQFWN